jgi:hypothetical protein
MLALSSESFGLIAGRERVIVMKLRTGTSLMLRRRTGIRKELLP